MCCPRWVVIGLVPVHVYDTAFILKSVKGLLRFTAVFFSFSSFDVRYPGLAFVLFHVAVYAGMGATTTAQGADVMFSQSWKGVALGGGLQWWW